MLPLTRRWRPLLWLAALFAVAAIGLFDFVTGPDISFSLLYLMPIVAAGWWLGPSSALAASFASTVAWLLADVGLHGREQSAIWIWNGFTRLTIFAAIGLLSARVRRDRDRLNELLARETTARVATLEQLRHRDRLATIGQLASGIAHELGTPLNVISGRARLILERPQDAVEDARHIVTQADRVAAIIRQLLDFARRRGPRLADTDLADVVRTTAAMLAPLAEKSRVTVTLGGEAPVMARVDPTQVQQAITNIAINGIQAMPAGGRLSLEVGRSRRRPPHEPVDQPGAPESDFLTVRISDSGGGIAREHLLQIFEPFFTTKPPGEGTGLGLSVAYGIVRDHGGWIDVASGESGSTFTLYLPAGEHAARAAAGPAMQDATQEVR